MSAFLKKSSAGEAYAAGPVLVHRDSERPYLSLDEPIVSNSTAEEKNVQTQQNVLARFRGSR